MAVAALTLASFGCAADDGGGGVAGTTGATVDGDGSETGGATVGGDSGDATTTTGEPICTGETLDGPITVESDADLAQLEGVTTIGGALHIIGVGSETLAQASCLESIAGDVIIMNNGNLADLSAFASVTEVEGDLVVAENGALVGIMGFGQVATVRHLSLSKNPLLVDTNGLDALTTVENNLIVRFNDELQDISSLRTLRTVGSVFNIVNNPKLCMSAQIAVVGEGLEIPLPPEIDYWTGNKEDC